MRGFTRQQLEKRIRQYIAKNGSIRPGNLPVSGKVLGQVCKRMPDLKLLGKEDKDYYTCARASVNVWGFK